MIKRALSLLGLFTKKQLKEHSKKNGDANEQNAIIRAQKQAIVAENRSSFHNIQTEIQRLVIFTANRVHTHAVYLPTTAGGLFFFFVKVFFSSSNFTQPNK